MSMNSARAFTAACALAAMAAMLHAAQAIAQGYPNKPVKLIVPFAPGGAVDIVGRTMGDALTKVTGQSFIVENRPGAGGLVALELVAKSPADGYTLAVGAAGPLTMSPNLFRDMKFDPLARLDPVIWFASTPGIVVVRSDLKATNIKELIALSKQKAGGLTMGSAGSGSIIHLMGEYFQSTAGVSWTHVPYKGSAPALTDMVAGRIDVMVDVVPTAAPYVKGGKMRALAATTPKRASELPDVPTLQELGFRDFDVSSWLSLLAPKGTPKEVIARLNGELNKSLQTPDMKARLAKIGAEPEGGTPEHMAARTRLELERWGKVIRDAGITVE